MKDRSARVLAIIALVFMAIFIASFIATLVDYSLLGGGIGIIAISSGVFIFMVFIALKADGRGFSLTKMKNESDMQKIEQALKEQDAAENPDKPATENADNSPQSDDVQADKSDK